MRCPHFILELKQKDKEASEKKQRKHFWKRRKLCFEVVSVLQGLYWWVFLCVLIFVSVLIVLCNKIISF